MDLINKKVMHKTFGTGKVVKYDDSYIRVGFPSGKKLFVFPDAFGKYLTLVDKRAASFVEKLVQQKENKRIELQNKRLQRFLEGKRAEETSKVHPQSQSVFWCRDEELDSVFTDWTIFTGLIKSGQKKELPRQLARLSRNSACLLTTRDPNTTEKERRILGVFMVNEGFNATQCADGYIPAHSKYRLRLSEQESAKMLFWNYYINRKYPHKMTWNTGRHRYFDNIWMAQILLDILSLKTEPRERESVEAFLRYFCQINLIEKKELPNPEGALIWKKTSSKTKK